MFKYIILASNIWSTFICISDCGKWLISWWKISFAFIVIQLLGIIGVMSQAACQVFVVFIPVIAVSLCYQLLILHCFFIFFSDNGLPAKIMYLVYFSEFAPLYNILWWLLRSYKLVILQQYYIPSARELSRLVGVCKAPKIQHYSETMSATSTIWSFETRKNHANIFHNIIYTWCFAHSEGSLRSTSSTCAAWQVFVVFILWYQVLISACRLS